MLYLWNYKANPSIYQWFKGPRYRREIPRAFHLDLSVWNLSCVSCRQTNLSPNVLQNQTGTWGNIQGSINELNYLVTLHVFRKWPDFYCIPSTNPNFSKWIGRLNRSNLTNACRWKKWSIQCVNLSYHLRNRFPYFRVSPMAKSWLRIIFRQLTVPNFDDKQNFS